MRRGVFVFMLAAAIAGSAGAGIHARPQAAQSTEIPAIIQLRRFVITLALGDVREGEWGKFTPEAQRALAGLKGFLPYKTYKLLDTEYMIGTSGPTLQLKGVDEKLLTFRMNGTAMSPMLTKISGLQLIQNPTDKSGARVLIETSFNLAYGETVVVGTSRLEGDRALLLLITSVR